MLHELHHGWASAPDLHCRSFSGLKNSGQPPRSKITCRGGEMVQPTPQNPVLQIASISIWSCLIKHYKAGWHGWIACNTAKHDDFNFLAYVSPGAILRKSPKSLWKQTSVLVWNTYQLTKIANQKFWRPNLPGVIVDSVWMDCNQEITESVASWWCSLWLQFTRHYGEAILDLRVKWSFKCQACQQIIFCWLQQTIFTAKSIALNSWSWTL